MDEILIEGRVFVSSKQAAKITGYAKDYVGQLCREGRVDARLVGRNWYVLQDSIREHRFGKAEEKEIPTEETATDRASTWESPQYHVETPAFVADLAPKAPSPAPNLAIQDMQSAWKEWFEEKKPVLVAPQGSFDVPVPEYEPVSVKEEVIEEVTISRIAPQEAAYVAPEAEEESEVEIHRSHDVRRHREQMSMTAPVSIDSAPRRPQEARKAQGRERSVEHVASSGIIRAVLVVLALIAGLTAMVGTGNAERLLAGTSFDFGAQKTIVDFLGGKSTYESSL